MSELQSWVRRTLWERVPRDHRQTTRDLRRRQIVTVGFVVLGALVLGYSLRLDPGSKEFYPAALVLAAVWAVGAFASGPLYLGKIPRGEQLTRPILPAIVIGLVLAAVFIAGALLIHAVPLFNGLENQIVKVVDYADQGSTIILVFITAINGIAEELFFRGAAYAAITKYPVVWTSVLYLIATAATGNIMLSFAAVFLGIVVGLQRRASGGILGPILTHCTWSLIMLFALPIIFL